MTFSFDKCYALNHLLLKNAFHLVENGRKMLAISHVWIELPEKLSLCYWFISGTKLVEILLWHNITFQTMKLETPKILIERRVV